MPDAKLEKWIIDRRVALLEQEGIDFVCDTDVGRDVEAEELRRRHDAVVVAIGSRVHRDLETPGRELANVHFAMDYLYQRNRWVARSQGRPARETPPEATISAEGGAWWWWAAATRGWTASRTPCARARRAC